MLNNLPGRSLALLTWLRLALLGLLLAFVCSAANAQVAITKIEIDGVNSSTTTKPPGSVIVVKVYITVSGGAPNLKSSHISFSATSSPPANCSYPTYPNGGGVANGSYVLTYNVTIPPIAGTYTLYYWLLRNPNCNGGAVASTTVPGAVNNGAAVLNHVRLQHDGVGQTCTPKSITVRACANAACSIAFTAQVTVSLNATSGTFSPNPLGFTGGLGTAALTKTGAGSTTISGSVTTPTGNAPVQCYLNGTLSAGSCSLVFGTTSCSLDSVEVGAAAQTDIFTKRTGAQVNLDVLTLLNGSLQTNSTATVTAVLVDASAGNCLGGVVSDTVTLPFTGFNGRRTFAFTPTVAARNVKVKMNTLANPSVIQCSTDAFAIRPASFSVTSAGANADIAGANANATPALKAGSAQVTLNAASFAGYNLAPQFNGQRIDAGNVAGAVGIRGTLDSVSGFGVANATTGTATATDFTYSEVGYVKLLPYAVFDDGDFADIDVSKGPGVNCLQSTALASTGAVADPNVAVGGKLGCYFGNVESNFFGRFTPDHYTVAPVSVLNRSAIPTCAVPGSFTYFGEPLSTTFTLTARSSGGVPTENYKGEFVKINSLTPFSARAVNAPATGARTVFAACGTPESPPCVKADPATVSAFNLGEGSVTLPLTIKRATATSGPFDDLQFGVAPVDLDTVGVAGFDLDTTRTVAPLTSDRALAGAAVLRYGRMNVDNTYGSELLNMGIKVSAQFWNGTRWVANPDDTCTPLTSSLFELKKNVGGIVLPSPMVNAADVNMSNASIVGGSPLAAGVGRIRLTKPVSPSGAPPGSKGSVEVHSKSSYLPGMGRATFGVYKAGPIIYVRETY